MFFFVPLYLLVVLNSVEGVENNETLKIENSNSIGNSNSSLSGNTDRNSSFLQDNLKENSNDFQLNVSSNLTANEMPQNFSQSDKIERKVEEAVNEPPQGFSQAEKLQRIVSDSDKNSEPPRETIEEKRPFEPSPTLGTVLEYEYNKVPVKPALSEPRLRFSAPSGAHDSPWIARDSVWRASENVVQTEHHKGEVQSAIGGKVEPESKYDYTTIAGTTALLGTTWNTKNHFPTQTSMERPYQFYSHPGFSSSGPSSFATGPSSYDKGQVSSSGLGSSGNGIGPSSYGLTPSSHGFNDGFSFNKPVEVTRRPQSNHHNNGQKTQLDCCPEDKPIREKTYYGGGYDGYLSHYGYSPWKKILKILTTIIPLGILISALTPSVIQITNVNDTQTATDGERYRSADSSKKEIADHLLSSLEYIEELNQNGCEYRVLCELLLSAKNTKNSKKNVDNLLNTFSERNFDVKSKKKELKRVFDAVRTHDCVSIPCELISS